MMPHLVPHAEPASAADVLALARRVRRPPAVPVVHLARPSAPPPPPPRPPTRLEIFQSLWDEPDGPAFLPGWTRPHPRRVLQLAARLFGLDVSDLTGESRTPRICRPRMMVMAALCALGYSLGQVGMVFCKHHTTVLHAVREVKDRPGDFEDYALLMALVRAEYPQGLRP